MLGLFRLPHNLGGAARLAPSARSPANRRCGDSSAPTSTQAADLAVLRAFPPRTLPALAAQRDVLQAYAVAAPRAVATGFCAVYLLMQTFAIPGTLMLSLLAGGLYGVWRGAALVALVSTAGSCSCYCLSWAVGQPLAHALWPDRIDRYAAEVARRRRELVRRAAGCLAACCCTRSLHAPAAAAAAGLLVRRRTGAAPSAASRSSTFLRSLSSPSFAPTLPRSSTTLSSCGSRPCCPTPLSTCARPSWACRCCPLPWVRASRSERRQRSRRAGGTGALPGCRIVRLVSSARLRRAAQLCPASPPSLSPLAARAGTLLGCAPQNFVAVNAGAHLGELRSLGDLYSHRLLLLGAAVGAAALLPVWLKSRAERGAKAAAGKQA